MNQKKSYYGEHDEKNKQSGLPSGTPGLPVKEEWISPEAPKKYRPGALSPHLKDTYWSSI